MSGMAMNTTGFGSNASRLPARLPRSGAVLPRVLLLAAVLLGVLRLALADTSSVTLHYQKVNNFTVKFVAVNMNDPGVTVTTAVAQGFPTHIESWGSFINRLQPDAAINGTYFCLRSYKPVGDVAVDGNLIYSGVVGTALCITPDNRVEMRPGPQQTRPNWMGFRTVLCAGPRLLTNGKLTVDARAEGFRDGHVLGSAPRSAVAWRPDGLLLLLTIEESISLTNLAYVCQHLGAVDAMALDGGNSSGLYAQGRTITRPGRGLSNILAVYSTPQGFAGAQPKLAPYAQTLISLMPPQVNLGWPALQPTAPASVPAPLAPGQTVRILKPEGTQPLRGIVPITIDVAKGKQVCWTTLRINGNFRAMGNMWPMAYQWNSTLEADGAHTIEVTAWSKDQQLIAREMREVHVLNGEQVAQR